MNFKILGTGSYTPNNVVTNDDLSTMVETNDEWITKRVGIKQRNISVEDTTSSMAIKAAFNALENSNVKAEDLDMIIVSTITPDRASPAVACMVQNAVGATCPAFDVSAACSGFIFALETAAAHMALGKAHKILVVGAERLSSITDFTDRSTCIIFADGAGAVVVSDEEDNLLASVLNTTGGDEVLNIPSATGTSPFYKGEKIEHTKIYMNGGETYKFAISSMQKDILNVMQQANLTNDNINWVVPHQANIRIIKEAARKLPIDKDKFCTNIATTGNTSSASVAILLDEVNRAGKINRGDNIIMAAFGAGLCSGAMAIRW
ncbi:MAG: beta-ketoacyl-ACP synthase III [Clostridia bacterium]